MLITTFISFFVSDSATTAMMIPIALAILEAMTGAPAKNTSATIADHLRLKELSKKQRGFCKAMILVCAHASLIGGTAILTSTAPNLIFRNELNRRYPNEPKVTMTYVKWLQFSLPPMFGYLIASYLIVMTVFIGPFSLFDCFRAPSEEEAHASKEVERSVKEAYKNLGSISFSEISVLFWFIVLIVSWIFREPGFMTGWADLIYGKEKSERFKDSTVGILIVFILFAWPKDFNIRSRNRKIADIEMETKGKTKGKASEEMKIVRRSEAILTWPVVQRRMSWSVLLLIGAGFAISEGVKSSGLSQWLACEVSAFKHLDEMVIQAAITAIIVFTTEFMSNGATANIFVPIVQTVAVSLHLHPLYLGIPSAIAPSFAFMLPMATPPNALVYDTHVVGFFEMLLVGTLLNCVCISITILSMNTWTYWLFDLGYVPDSVLLINNATLNC
ncbi:unnamed protein product, partial [Mesorhabditis belari]|uniref:Uncharacterized protein n=1 Tax=Mesorhabditis belari TaxID=2138241 RepID=A0AAF3E8B6_9BILA